MSFSSNGMDFSPYEDMTHGNDSPIFGIRILQYFNDDGELVWKMDYSGEIHVTQMLGLMDLAIGTVRQRAIMPPPMKRN